MSRHNAPSLFRPALLTACITTALSAACSGPSPSDAGNTDATDAAQPQTDDAGVPLNFFPAPAPAFTSTTNDPRTIQVTVSGEDLAQAGYDYTASPAMDAPVFVDGWEVRFDRYLLVVGNVRLNQAGADPSMRAVLGAEVARENGPWVVDLHRAGSVPGAGGEQAVPLFVFRAPASGGSFDPMTRYAFSFEQVPANTPGLRNANLEAADRPALEAMIRNGWSTYFSGTATYRGRAPSGTVDATFQSYPTAVRFELGFRAHTAYLNCHNPEIGEQDEPANRGVQPSATRAVRAQITMHTDHFFWDQANVEGTPLHFDPLAARVQGFGPPPTMMRMVTVAELASVNPAALIDQTMMPVMDRGAQTAGYTATGRLVYRTNGAEVSDLREFAVYNARQGGHMNADGLCHVQVLGPIAF